MGSSSSVEINRDTINQEGGIVETEEGARHKLVQSEDGEITYPEIFSSARIPLHQDGAILTVEAREKCQSVRKGGRGGGQSHNDICICESQ